MRFCSVDREPRTQRLDARMDGLFRGGAAFAAFTGKGGEDLIDHEADFPELRRPKAACGGRRAAKADARGDGGFFGVEGNGVLVGG